MKSDTSQCSQESGGLKKDYKMLDLYNKKVQSWCPTLTEPHHNTIRVLECQKSTNIPPKSSNTNSRQLKIGETAQKSIQTNYQTLICSVEDFLAKHSQSLENGGVSKIPEEHSFLKLQEFLKLKDLKLYSLKTSKAYSITTKGRLSPSSWKRWQNWSMKLNGWYLTANFSEFPRTERGYSLSEVLEGNVDQKYYLSDSQTGRLMKNMESKSKECSRKMDGISDTKISEDTITQMESVQQFQQDKAEESCQKSEQSSPQTDQRNDKTEEDSKKMENQVSHSQDKIYMESQTDSQSEDSPQSNVAVSRDSQTIGTNLELTNKEKQLK